MEQVYTLTRIKLREPNIIKALSHGRQPASDVELIYQRYLQAFKKGAYNYIKEECQLPATQQVVPRKYFSGGTFLGNLDLRTRPTMDFAQNAAALREVDVRLDDAAMNTNQHLGTARIKDRAKTGDRHTYTRIYPQSSEAIQVYQDILHQSNQGRKDYLRKFIQAINGIHSRVSLSFQDFNHAWSLLGRR